jgi:predicted  nucleic acid-binding Zn-ribbon protein
MAAGDTSARNMLQIVIDLVKSEVGHVQKRIDGIDKRIDDITKTIEKGRDGDAALNKELAYLKGQYESLNSVLGALNTKVNDLEKTMSSKGDVLSDLRAESKLNGKSVAANSGITAVILAIIELARYLFAS